MAIVDFLHLENPSTWAGVEPEPLGAEGQRQTDHATQPATMIKLSKTRSRGGGPKETDLTQKGLTPQQPSPESNCPRTQPLLSNYISSA
ncbi:hypothetical protein TNCV_4969321 [Trichonephila clavipes]|nr:hypothetical protein TNCV_4969321 [Trichonephila clavipes]